MWLDEYNTLSSGDQERTRKIINYLLNKTYVVSDIYEPRDRAGKVNVDYRFLLRNFDIFKGYFDLAGYDVLRDDERGFIYVESRYNANNYKLDKVTTLFLITLRQIYDEEMEKNSSKSVCFVKVNDVVIRMLENALILKRLTIKERVDVLRILSKYNVVGRIEGALEDENCTIVIYPTIYKAVSNEKITAIYSVMFKEDSNNDGFDFGNNTEEIA